MAYDPDENLLYVGTGNGSVWSADVRNGGRTAKQLDNLYVASIIAINADTGQLKWHYQCTPGDEWDYDAIQHLLLADIRINNRNRKVVMQANKNGYFYVIDRTNGEFISASEMSQVSWATGIDPKTGRPNVHPDALYSEEKGTTVYPVQMHNTSQMSFNPNTGLIYVPIAVENTFSFVAAKAYEATPGRQNFGLNLGGARGGVPMASPPPHGPERKNADGSKVRGGILTAWDPATQKERWFSLGGGQTGGGALSLASNLVIQTLSNGRMKAFTADKGEQLLDVALPVNAGVGPPMTFMLDGKQYTPSWAKRRADVEARDAERRRLPEQRLKSRQPRQLKAQTMLHRRLPLPGPTTRNCWFTLFRTEGTSRLTDKHNRRLES
jgi:outer membrane protein assembly factor BamB